MWKALDQFVVEEKVNFIVKTVSCPHNKAEKGANQIHKKKKKALKDESTGVTEENAWIVHERACESQQPRKEGKEKGDPFTPWKLPLCAHYGMIFDTQQRALHFSHALYPRWDQASDSLGSSSSRAARNTSASPGHTGLMNIWNTRSANENV